MRGGTLLVSRAVNWFPYFKERLEAFGFPNVHVTAAEKDGLNLLINELKPDYVLVGSNFYDCGTPYMVGQMLSVFPKLNISVISTSPFPDAVAAWFIFHGVKYYVKLYDGENEFKHGMQCILDRKKYIAPEVQVILNGLKEFPDVPLNATKRQKEILLMLCCGFTIRQIVEMLHICKVTVEKHIKELMKIYNSRGREELIKTAHCLDIFTKKELGFYDTGKYNVILPEWAQKQQLLNHIANNKFNRGIEC